jgi:hypothetical protein
LGVRWLPVTPVPETPHGSEKAERSADGTHHVPGKIGTFRLVSREGLVGAAF